MTTTQPTPQQILDAPMRDFGEATIRDHLVALLAELWKEQDNFSAERVFGNNDWDWELHGALGRAGWIRCRYDEDGDLTDADKVAGNALITAAIQALAAPAGPRYALVEDDDGHHYVVEADHVDEWYELDDDQINDGPAWAWPVGGAPNQVTFTNPLIFGEPLAAPSRE